VRTLGIGLLILANIVVIAQTQKPPAGGVIQGIVQSGNAPIPGATVTATGSAGKEKITTSTDPNGQYQLRVPAGAYTVDAAMAAFAPISKSLEIKDPSIPSRLDFDLTLASRSQQAAPPKPAVGFRGRGSQQLEVEQTAEAEEPASEPQPEQITAQVQPDLATPGLAADAPTESVAVLGNTAETTFGNNFNFDRQQIQQFIDAQFGLPPVQAGGVPGQPGADAGQAGVPGGQGGFFGRGGGGGGGRGGGGSGGRGGGFGLGRGGRGFAATGPRGNLSYQLSDSAFDAAPYAICATPPCNITKPRYMQNQFTATVGGPLVIPHVVKTTNTNYNVSYNGSRSQNPADFFSTVPTLAERAGDFSQTTIRNGANAGNPVQIFDPVTHLPLQNNAMPQFMLNPASLGLLKFIPEPNLPGSIQNFHFFTAATNDSDSINLRLNHTFASLQQQQTRGRRNGAPRVGGGGGGGRRGAGAGGFRRGSNINFGLNWTSSNGAVSSPFPSVGGSNTRSGLQATLGYIRPIGGTNNSINVQYNRNRTTGTNLYAFHRDVEGFLGITGVSANPFDWGLPNLSFTNFSGLNDTRAAFRRDQTIQFSDGMIYTHNRHNFRWGGDFRISQAEMHSSQNSRGTFTFTGLRTAALANGIPVQNTGYDFADFLLGLPQQTALQLGALTYNFRGNSWDAFIQDDWRIRGNLTIQYGLRYDYASPYTERDNQLVNLDVAPGFAAAVPVLPGQTGPYHGSFPEGLVKPDRNNFSPRLGLAWRLTNRTTIRAGYGVTYNGSAYSTIATQMANQPPFSQTQTNIYSAVLPLSLQNGFPVSTAAAVTNNYGIDPNYRIGYAQTWNLDLQRDLRKLGLVLNLDYTGTKGTRLDIIEAPNRTATGLRIPGVQPFNWEASEGNSILHSGAVRLNRRLGRGVSFGGTYQFSKSIDNASTVSGAGGQGVVAQDAFDLRAERGPSAFDIRHRAAINYNVELPFGTNKLFLAKDSVFKTFFGDWLLNGNWAISSGSPLTVHVLGSYTDVNRGSNGSLRAQATGLPAALDHPTIAEWFDTAAFTLPPAGQFGDVGRNTIRGPGQVVGNLAINKTFTFWDGRSFDVRIQSTNFLNMPIFRGVDTNVNSPTFGKITSAGQMRRIQLFARFNF
jgi:trimeric autotransporter adhesin